MRRGQSTRGLHQNIQICTLDITNSEHLKHKLKIVLCGLHEMSKWQKRPSTSWKDNASKYKCSASYLQKCWLESTFSEAFLTIVHNEHSAEHWTMFCMNTAMIVTAKAMQRQRKRDYVTTNVYLFIDCQVSFNVSISPISTIYFDLGWFLSGETDFSIIVSKLLYPSPFEFGFGKALCTITTLLHRSCYDIRPL